MPRKWPGVPKNGRKWLIALISRGPTKPAKIEVGKLGPLNLFIILRE